jgi:hypothetical protein
MRYLIIILLLLFASPAYAADYIDSPTPEERIIEKRKQEIVIPVLIELLEEYINSLPYSQEHIEKGNLFFTSYKIRIEEPSLEGFLEWLKERK